MLKIHFQALNGFSNNQNQSFELCINSNFKFQEKTMEIKTLAFLYTNPI